MYYFASQKSLNYQDRSNFDCYIVSIYWAICTLSTVGFGDVHAYNNSIQIITTYFLIYFKSGILFIDDLDDIWRGVLFLYRWSFIQYDSKLRNKVEI